MQSPSYPPNNPAAVSDVSLLSAIDGYLRYYAGSDNHTAKAKQLDARNFVDFLREYHGLSRVEKLKLGDWDASAVEKYVETRLQQGEAPATVSRRLATIKHMGRMLSERIPGFVNPARSIKSPRLRVSRPKALSTSEVEEVTEHARERRKQRNSFARLRNEAMFHLLLDTGLRADEARTLKRSQLDESLEWIKNVRTKGRSFRNVYVSSAAREPLRLYIEARKRELSRFFGELKHQIDVNLPLFISTYNVKADDLETFFLDPKTVWRAINDLSTDTRLHPHLLRHSYATQLLEHTRDIRLVSQALGHSDLKVTMRYTERQDELVAQAVESLRKGNKSRS